MRKVIVYRYETPNTAPRGFGAPPAYSLDKISEHDELWRTAIPCMLPDGYEVAENTQGELMLWDASGEYVAIVDDHGHPSIIIGGWRNKKGKPYVRYQRLDKGVGQQDDTGCAN